MRCISLFLFLSITSASLFAQQLDAGRQSLVDAERNFSAMAKSVNTRDAFLHFLADDAITFGEKPRTGKKHLEAQQPNQSWLFWEPVYTDLSASGDFGFNTGPWEFRKSKTDQEAVAYGQFISIWKKINGEWRVAVDLGMGHDKPGQKESLHTSSIVSKRVGGKVDNAAVLAMDKDFIDAVEKGQDAYAKWLSDEARVYRNGLQPMITKEAIRQWKASDTEKITYTPIGYEASSAGDMAFVYGTATVDTLVDGKTTGKNANYMRIWKKEDGKQWRVVLEVVAAN